MCSSVVCVLCTVEVSTAVEMMSCRLTPDRTGPRARMWWIATYQMAGVCCLPPNMSTGPGASPSASTNTTAINIQRAIQDDTKPRRSTKVSGKLKVLPEQPEPGPVPTKRALLAPAQGGEGSNATGESDDDDGDGDGGPDEDETEDVDVRFPFSYSSPILLMPTPNPIPHRPYTAGNINRRITKSHGCPREPRVVMRCVSRRRKQSPFLE